MNADAHHKALAPLQCPHCGSDLTENTFQCSAPGCGRSFRSVLGIPDLRIREEGAETRFDVAKDWTLACLLAEAYPNSSFRDLVDRLWQHRVRQEIVSQQSADLRVSQIEHAWMKHAEDLSEAGWLAPLIPPGPRTRVLDLGCGPGGFLVAAGRHFAGVAGVDISMTWLIICLKRLETERIPARLACAYAERLPFKRDAFDLVVSFDALEHVTDRDRVVGEAHRVLRPGGVVVCTTPNRFSVSAEPHCQVWGVGLLPRGWMPAYVRWRSGRDYHSTHLLSTFEIRRLFGRYFGGDCRVMVPELWDRDIERFRPAKRVAARLYNLVIRQRLLRAILTVVAPFFRIVARKNVTGRE